LNNYSSSQKLLHKIALSSSFLRETFFDLEKSFFLKEDFEIDTRYVFISGMARSGTTILLNAIYETNEFASLTYQDMPFILSPNIWSRLNKHSALVEKQERAHNDGIKIDTNSPEAFEEVFWKTFDDNDSDSYRKFMYFVQLLCLKYKKNRYLSKNNQNIKRIKHLINNYPNSKVIVPFREPLQHSFSLFTQHKKFISLQKNDDFIRKYMSLIGHSEFGLDYMSQFDNNLKYSDSNNINHWLEQWFLTYRMLSQFLNSSQVLFVCYEELCKNHFIYRSVLDFIDISFVHGFDFRLSLKEINLEYDSELYNKCLNSYSNLRIQM
tara:strand:- start:85 stop:1053 length:969 start_codon:yes stop_codon:yes gene_type:complete